jgi:hypothetical protein
MAITRGPTTPTEAGYWVLVSNATTGEEHTLDRHKLALAWIYGDVVHHDEGLRQEADPFGLTERFRGAVPLVAWTMVATIELLNYIRALHSDGVLQLRREVLDEPVALQTTTWEYRAEIYHAPAGTGPPTSAAAPLPADWIRLTGAADELPRFHTAMGGQLVHAGRSGTALAPPGQPAVGTSAAPGAAAHSGGGHRDDGGPRER